MCIRDRSVILQKDIGPEQVAMCMVAVKLSRLIHQPTHDDSWADIIGYGGVGRGIADIERDVQDAVKDSKRDDG